MPSSSKKVKAEPFESSRDWLLWGTGAAWTEVRRTDVPSEPDLKPLVQLLISSFDRHESWTVFYDRKNPKKSGKMMIKRWDIESDRKRFRALKDKPLPRELRSEPAIIQEEIALSNDGIARLQRTLSRLKIPPVTRPTNDPISGLTHEVRFWSGTAQIKFSWRTRPPAAWKPLARLFAISRRLSAQPETERYNRSLFILHLPPTPAKLMHI